MPNVNVSEIRREFPILQRRTPLGKDLIYLDNAASTQKPAVVVKSMEEFYTGYYSNIGRGSYWPASASTQAYEEAREKVSTFIKASSPQNIVFTAGTTDSVNKVASSFLRPRLKAGDEVVISEMEHHSNLIPWQVLCQENGAHLRVIPILETGDLDLEAYSNLLSTKTKMVAVTAVSNTLGVVNDIRSIGAEARNYDIPVFVDAAQAVAHMPLDAADLECDFLAFSGHKIYGPTGIGVLYGKHDLLEEMLPAQYGGGTVKEVMFDESRFRESPHKHEAGTPNIAGAIGLGAALDFVNNVGMEQVTSHTHDLLDYAVSRLKEIEGLEIPGNPQKRAPVFSIVMGDIHPHDIAGFLNEDGIAIRAGHHCTQPLMNILGVPGTSRISFAMYNTKEEIDELVNSLVNIRDFFT